MRTKYTSLYFRAEPDFAPTLPSTMGDRDRLMTSREVATMLGVDISWVKNHCTRSAPFLPFVQLGDGRYATRRFRREDIIRFIEARVRVPRIE